MARISLAVCVTILMALNGVYETQGTFSLPHYLENFPKVCKDFDAFASKGMSDFMSDLESKCPKTAEFTDFFANLKDYMAYFSSASPGSKDNVFEMSKVSEKLFRTMSKMEGSGITPDSWRLVDSLLTLGKNLVEMKKCGSKELTFEDRKELIGNMVKWTRAIGLFVKTASEKKGQSIDLSVYGVDYDFSSSSSKRTLYETQETFSLPLYLKNFPKMGKDFEPFAYKGMSDFLGSLESKCPATTEFKDFFANLEDFMTCFKSASPGSKDMKFEMAWKSERLLRAVSPLDGIEGGTSVDFWRMLDGLLSMGKVLVDMKKHGSEEITFETRKECFGAMIKWARSIGLFVKAASERNGKSIDLSSFGIDYVSGNGQGSPEEKDSSASKPKIEL